MMDTAAKWELAAKWGCSLPLIIIALLPFIGYPIREFQTSNGRKTLPADATHVKEDLIHGFFGGDHTRLLMASMPAIRFSEYAKSLGLYQRFDPGVHQGFKSILNTKIGGAPLWWTPPEVDSTTYFEHKNGDDYLRVLRYHNGTVYLLESSW
ncbi:MAG: hypothetical protein ACK49J_13215 [Verrucomicrobiota bacterium]